MKTIQLRLYSCGAVEAATWRDAASATIASAKIDADCSGVSLDGLIALATSAMQNII